MESFSLIKKFISELNFLILLTIILLIPFNLSFINFPIREVLFLLFIILIFVSSGLNKKIIYVNLLFILIYFSSSINGINNDYNVPFKLVDGLYFYLYYFFIINIYFIVQKIELNYKKTNIINYGIYISIFILLSYILLFFPLLNQYLPKTFLRPSFIYGSNNEISQLSFTISCFFIYCLIKDKKNYFDYIIIILSFYSLFLIESKSGFFAILSSILIYSFYKTVRYFHLNIYSKKFKIYFALISLLFFVLFIIFINYINSSISFMDLSFGDYSIQSRINKLSVAFGELENYFPLLGNSGFYSYHRWYDGLISIITAHIGLLGLFILIVLFYKILLSYYETNYIKSFMFNLSIILPLNFSEYIFTSRSFFVIFIFFLIIYMSEKKKKQNVF